MSSICEFGPTVGAWKQIQTDAIRFRSDMKDFAPSCFHSASTGGGTQKSPHEAGRKARKYLEELVAGVGFEPTTFRL